MISNDMYSRRRNESDELFDELCRGELDRGRSIAVRGFQLVSDVSVISQREPVLCKSWSKDVSEKFFQKIPTMRLNMDAGRGTQAKGLGREK